MSHDRTEIETTDTTPTRFRYQTLAIAGGTLLLFLLAVSNNFYRSLHTWLNGEPWLATGQKMRDIGIELVIRPETGSPTSLDHLLTFGLFASLGLSAFAFQQSWRLKRA